MSCYIDGSVSELIWAVPCLQVPSDRFQGVTAATLVRSSGINTTAVVYEDSAYGYGLAFNFIAGFTKGEHTQRGLKPALQPDATSTTRNCTITILLHEATKFCSS
jgi:hypothetical protein